MTTQAILFMQKFGYGMTGLVLTQRTYRIFLQVAGGYGYVLQFKNGAGKSQANTNSVSNRTPSPRNTIKKMR